MDEGGGEMRFSLPAAPSPGPLLFLLAACRELARAGGHTTGAVAVQLLQWELGNAVLQAFRCCPTCLLLQDTCAAAYSHTIRFGWVLIDASAVTGTLLVGHVVPLAAVVIVYWLGSMQVGEDGSCGMYSLDSNALRLTCILNMYTKQTKRTVFPTQKHATASSAGGETEGER